MKKIAYSEWLTLIGAVCQKGRSSEEFTGLKNCEPLISGSGGESLVQNEIGKLLVILIKDAIDALQKTVNLSFEERDLYILEKGLREFKNAVGDFLFFDGMECLSGENKAFLKGQISLNVGNFIREYSGYMKKLSEFDNTRFIDEFMYIYKKANIKKFIQESGLL